MVEHPALRGVSLLPGWNRTSIPHLERVGAEVTGCGLPSGFSGHRADRPFRGMPSPDPTSRGQGDGQPCRTAGTCAAVSASNVQLIPQVLGRVTLPAGLLPLAYDGVRPEPVFQIAEVLGDRFGDVERLDRPVRRANCTSRSSSPGAVLRCEAVMHRAVAVRFVPVLGGVG